jgi:outer membrane protein assembly factor BamB
MRTRAWAGGFFLGIGLWVLAAQLAQALISSPYPLSAALDHGTFILIAKVESLDADKLKMMLKPDEHLKGKGPFAKMPVTLQGDADAAKLKHTPQFLKRLAVGVPLVLFVNQKDKDYLALGYTNGTWFQLTGIKPEDSDTVRWSFTHLEPYLRRTYKGTTDEMRQVVVESLEGKRKPPDYNPKEAPGFGPELTPEKPPEKQPEKPQSRSNFKIQDGPVFGVIALPTLAAPLAVLAILFPSLFGGWKRWLAGLSVICTISTISFVFWLFAVYLNPTPFGKPLVQWLIQTAGIFLTCCWAWNRHQPTPAAAAAMGEIEQPATAPGRTELMMLLAFSLLGVVILLVAHWFRALDLKSQLWLLIGVICVSAWVTTGYVALRMRRGGDEPGLPREVVMLTAMTLFAIGLTALQQSHASPVSGTAVNPGELAWTFDLKERGLIASAPLVEGDRTYVSITHEGVFGTNEGAVYCLDGATGKPLWTTLKKLKMKAISLSAPVLAKGRLYVGEGFHENSDCKLHCLEAESGKLLWAFPTGSHVEASPAVVDGRVYFGAGDDGMYCVDADSGKEIWHFPGLHIDSTPLVEKGRVYAGSGVGDVVKETAIVCVGADKGGLIWKHPLKLPAWGAPVRAGDLVYFGIGNGRLNASDETSPQGALLAVKAETGEEVWRFKARDSVLCRPAVDDKCSRVYFGSRDGFVYCVDRFSGKLCWKRQFGGPVVTEVALARDPLGESVTGVFALSEVGQVYCLEPQGGQVIWLRDLPRGWFKLSDKAADALLAAGMPEGVLAKLKTLKNQEFTSEERFVTELAKLLAENERERFQALLLQHTLVKLSEAPLQMWSAPTVTVTGDKNTQVRRLTFGVNIGLSGTVPMICCFEEHLTPSEDQEDDKVTR